MAPLPERQWTGCLMAPTELHLKNGELFVSPFNAFADSSIAKLEDYLEIMPDGVAGKGRVVTV